ncbi:MAG: tRNA lysidine(34) synthetase TilS, partial [Ktedonobacterales bacterium]
PRRGEAGSEVPLPIPGALDLPAVGWRLTARILPAPLAAATLHAPPPLLVDAATGFHLPCPRAYLDADIAGGALLVRTWRPGDRIQPLGMHSEKKLQDLFTDAKVPRALRTRLPLVCGADSLLWVAGLRSDERARVTDATTRVLVLNLEPLVS